MRLGSLHEHALLTMWVQLLVILVVARALGIAMRRIGQPPVVGELLAGVLLGPSVLAKVWPAAERFIAPTDPGAAAPLNAIGWVGVAFLLVLTGFETDLRIVRRLGRPAMLVAVGGLVVPFVAGLGVGTLMPDSFMGGHGTTTAFVLFIAVSLSISSLPVIAKILDELGLMRRNFGQVTVAVGMVNDLIGWVALGVISALGKSSHLSAGEVLIPVVAIAALLAFSFTGGQRGVDYLLQHLRRRDAGGIDVMTVTIAVTFLFAVLAQVSRSDAVLGAYIAGILIGRSRFFQRRIRQQLESLTMAVFAPLFFATAGLRIDLASLARPSALVWAGIILAVAMLTKLAGAFGGARLAGLHAREGLALSVGLNCRGAVEVVIATVGLTIGVLSTTAYTAIVLMAIVTSVMAPPLLRLIVRDWRGGDEEQARLDQEEAMERNLLIRSGRVLLPSRGGPGSVAAAQVVAAAWPRDVPVTVLSLADDGRSHDVSDAIAALGDRESDVRETGGVAHDAILEEAKLGYGVITVGARDAFASGAMLSPVIDELLARVNVPMVIVRRSREAARDGDVGTGRFRRALVPVDGAMPSRTAQELAYSLARTMDTEIVLTHVLNRPGGHSDEVYPRDPDAAAREPERAAALVSATGGIVGQAVRHAEEHDVSARTDVRVGTATADEILLAAQEHGVDLVVVGTTVRRLQDRSFLGHTVEHVLDHCEATVIVVAIPDVLVAEGISDRDS